MSIQVLLILVTAGGLIAYGRSKTMTWPTWIFVASPLIACLIWGLSMPRAEGEVDLNPAACLINTLLGIAGVIWALIRSKVSLFGVALLFFGGLMLVALLAPPKSYAGRAARRIQCMSNLHQIIIAVHNYASVNDGHMPPAGTEPYDLSWRVQILPLMDQSALYRSYQRDKPWNDPANDEFTKIWIKAYSCPSNPNLQDSQGRYYTAYALMTGTGTAFDGPKTLSLDDIAAGPGLTHTMLMGEACGANIVWNEPRDIDVARERPGVNLPGKTRGTSGGWLSTYHKAQVNVAFADGSVKSLSVDTDPEVLKAMIKASK
jgi:prepilin-type processing-associated H-X9-DG protein